jgi:hypothetical protein
MKPLPGRLKDVNRSQLRMKKDGKSVYLQPKPSLLEDLVFISKSTSTRKSKSPTGKHCLTSQKPVQPNCFPATVCWCICGSQKRWMMLAISKLEVGPKLEERRFISGPSNTAGRLNRLRQISSSPQTALTIQFHQHSPSSLFAMLVLIHV